MNKRLLSIQVIKEELEKFDEYYRLSIKSDNPRIDEIINYTLRADGKRIRPILTFLAAKACGEPNNVTYDSAITVELLHTASLIHDDVVDESKIRRGRASLNAVYDNKMAVLAGDYFLSTALIKSVFTGNIDIISNISNLGRSLAEGELNQLSIAKAIILDEKEYFEVIRKKTASLLSTCMRIGAISVNASEEEVERFAELGDIIGICFQLKDDIFDYFTNDIGKPTGNDIREGKITLPLLHALAQSESSLRDKFMEIINSYDYTPENFDMLLKFAKESGGIEYTYSKIDEYKGRGEELIKTIRKPEVRSALMDTLNYIVERSY